tara:strand:- start:438 stop:779 length:342 start_codon:yes stop_codon:yes gene_type:complete
MNSLIEQIEMWVTNLIDARISQRGPTQIEVEVSEARVIELIDNHLTFSLTDDKLQEQIHTILNGNSPEDVGLNMDYYLHEDSDISCYLELDDFVSKDDIQDIIEDATITIKVN